VTSAEVVSNVVDRPAEARKARRRLYPVTVLYTLFATVVLVAALRNRPRLALLSFGLGIALWTALEYYAHRFVLHGRFPDGPGLFQHFLHKYFDHLHWEHHKRPWDGNHINGTIADTLPLSAPLALLGLLLPSWSLSALLAGLLQAYIVEEWVHHSVHFYEFRGRYFRYIKRHHLYHHSPKGMNVAYGLTNGLWDIVFDTRIPADVRLSLYRDRRSERPAA
jgi:sterol desaturase/sphingolipid hydroxylase (fatty acid hydroxylase superfamily)